MSPSIVNSISNTLAVPEVQFGSKMISSSVVINTLLPELLNASSGMTEGALGPLTSISNPSLPLSAVISVSFAGH